MCLKESAPFTKVQPSGLKKFSLKEVKMHNTEKDAWLVNSGKWGDNSCGWVGWFTHRLMMMTTHSV